MEIPRWQLRNTAGEQPGQIWARGCRALRKGFIPPKKERDCQFDYTKRIFTLNWQKVWDELLQIYRKWSKCEKKGNVYHQKKSYTKKEVLPGNTCYTIHNVYWFNQKCDIIMLEIWDERKWKAPEFSPFIGGLYITALFYPRPFSCKISIL